MQAYETIPLFIQLLNTSKKSEEMQGLSWFQIFDLQHLHQVEYKFLICQTDPAAFGQFIHPVGI
ncbi:MAG: hypothetical protein J5825_07475, partial [Lachnospiraceae bacterium]|nr:hypothetical protein [Lachnospiraceae bacterium]